MEDAGPMPLTAYRIGRVKAVPVPAQRERDWMNDSPDRFANRCLPLLMANQAGWHILNPCAIEVVWLGGSEKYDTVVTAIDWQGALPVTSHFGCGIITWHLPFLFRTPPEYNLLVRGPANWPKDGICALEGLVETDWATATFTMNWKLTRAGLPVRFEVGEPICCIVPQRRYDLEQFSPRVVGIEEDEVLSVEHATWAESRREFLAQLESAGPPPQQGWQRHYVQGSTPTGARADQHQTKLHLREFASVADRAPIATASKEPGSPELKASQSESADHNHTAS